MKPKPFSSLNHFTVPVVIQKTPTAIYVAHWQLGLSSPANTCKARLRHVHGPSITPLPPLRHRSLVNLFTAGGLSTTGAPTGPPVGSTDRVYRGSTFSAAGPFRPWPTSNLTFWPSF